MRVFSLLMGVALLAGCNGAGKKATDGLADYPMVNSWPAVGGRFCGGNGWRFGMGL